MTFVTKLKLQSGNRSALETCVAKIQSIASQKGAQLKGPHSNPTTRHRVPQYKDLSGDASKQFAPWHYTVYTRELEIVGHNEVARRITHETSFPDCIHVEAEVEQIQPMGHTA